MDNRAHPFKAGFRELRWGDPAPPEMVALVTDGPLIETTRPGDRLFIGKAALRRISYTYFNNRLALVSLVIAADSLNPLVEVFREAFGGPTTGSGAGFSWFLGNGTPDATTVSVHKWLDFTWIAIIGSVYEEEHIAKYRSAQARRGLADL